MSNGCEQFEYVVASHCLMIARKRWTRTGLLNSSKWPSNCHWPCPYWPVSKLWMKSIDRNIPGSLVFFIILIVTLDRGFKQACGQSESGVFHEADFSSFVFTGLGWMSACLSLDNLRRKCLRQTDFRNNENLITSSLVFFSALCHLVARVLPWLSPF